LFNFNLVTSWSGYPDNLSFLQEKQMSVSLFTFHLGVAFAIIMGAFAVITFPGLLGWLGAAACSGLLVLSIAGILKILKSKE